MLQTNVMKQSASDIASAKDSLENPMEKGGDKLVISRSSSRGPTPPLLLSNDAYETFGNQVAAGPDAIPVETGVL